MRPDAVFTSLAAPAFSGSFDFSAAPAIEEVISAVISRVFFIFQPLARRAQSLARIFLTSPGRHLGFGRKDLLLIDKRRGRRAQLDIYINKYVGGVPYLARTSDISPTGVALAHLIEPANADPRVGLQFQLPGSRELIY